MSNIVKFDYQGISFTKTDQDEPRVLDVDIAKAVCMAKPTNIRTTIKKAIDDGLLTENAVSTRRVLTEVIGVAPREVTEYWLNETGTLLLVTRLKTAQAVAITQRIVQGYVAARNFFAAKQPSAAERERDTMILYAESRMRMLKMWENSPHIIGPTFLQAEVNATLAMLPGQQTSGSGSPTVHILIVDKYLIGKKVPRAVIKTIDSQFGSHLARAYFKEYGEKPEKAMERIINGIPTTPNCYTEKHRFLFDKVYSEKYPHIAEEYP